MFVTIRSDTKFHKLVPTSLTAITLIPLSV